MIKRIFLMLFSLVCSKVFFAESFMNSDDSFFSDERGVLESENSFINNHVLSNGNFLSNDDSFINTSSDFIESDQPLGSYSVVVKKNSTDSFSITEESKYQQTISDVYANGYGKWLKTVTAVNPNARTSFAQYFSDWQWSGQNQDFYSYSADRAEREKQLELSYDKAVEKFGIGTAIIATTWMVSFIVPGGTIYQAAVLILAKAATAEAISGGAIGGVISCGIGLLQGKSGDELIYETVTGVSDGYVIGAITGLVSGGVKVAREVRRAANFKSISGTNIIFNGKIYDSAGRFISNYSDDVFNNISKASFIKDLPDDSFFHRYAKETEEFLKKHPDNRLKLSNINKELQGIKDSRYLSKTARDELNKRIDDLWYALEDARASSYKITNYVFESSKFTAEEIKKAVNIAVNDKQLLKYPNLFKTRYIRGENGIIYKIASPNFPYMAELQLPENLLKIPDGMAKKTFENMQFKWCTEELIKHPEKFALSEFDKNYILKTGAMPYDTVWHHDIQQGRMLLVSKQDHDLIMGGAAHTGGDSLWKILFPSGK